MITVLIDKKTDIYNRSFDSVDCLLAFYNDAQTGDLEAMKYNRHFYKKLNWTYYSNFDVISSFWHVASSLMIFWDKQDMNSWKINDLTYKWNDKLYIEGSKTKIAYKTQNGYLDINKETYMKKADDPQNIQHFIFRKFVDEHPNLKLLAGNIHCVANFMPCPAGFNSAKGCLDEVLDYFPLMIDKIQKCIDGNCGFEYRVYDNINNKNKKIVVDINQIKEWHNFFVNNQENLHLDMYYNIENNKLVGIPFFEKQSLTNPKPSKENIYECLANINLRIFQRALKLCNEIEQ